MGTTVGVRAQVSAAAAAASRNGLIQPHPPSRLVFYIFILLALNKVCYHGIVLSPRASSSDLRRCTNEPNTIRFKPHSNEQSRPTTAISAALVRCSSSSQVSVDRELSSFAPATRRCSARCSYWCDRWWLRTIRSTDYLFALAITILICTLVQPANKQRECALAIQHCAAIRSIPRSAVERADSPRTCA